jgi:curved DNA-binding protein CbpA
VLFRSQQQQQQQQQHQQEQQRPHTRGPSSLEIKRTKALLTLGLPAYSNPTYADVKQAYKRAALENHPDKAKAVNSPDETADRTKKFIEANEAYKFLISNLRNQNGGNMAKIGGNNTIKRRHKKHKLAKKTRSKKHSNRRNKTRGKTYRKTRKNTTKRR